MTALVRVVACGVDTLQLFSTQPLDPVWVETLRQAKSTAETLPRDAPLPEVDLADHRLTVRPHGARSMPLLVDGPHLAFKFNPSAPAGLPTVVGELRSLFLWQRGPSEAARAALQIFESVTGACPALPSDQPGVTRVDFAVDFQGWIPVLTDIDRFTRRARKRAAYWDGDALTGFAFGRGGEISARIYDKTREIRESNKTWFIPVWQEFPGFEPEEPVWRLEFQLRREGIRSFRPGDGVPPLHSWGDASMAASKLWTHLLTQWLSLRAPRSASNRQRLDLRWEVLRSEGSRRFASMWGGTAIDLFRCEQEASSARTDGQLAGYLARAIGHEQFRRDSDGGLDALGSVVVRRAAKHAERKGRPIDARARELAERLRQADREALGKVGDSSPSVVNEEVSLVLEAARAIQSAKEAT